MQENQETLTRPWYSFGCVGLMTPTDVRNLGRFNLSMLSWGLSWAVALFALRLLPELPAPLRYAIAALPTLVALAAILAYLRFLRQADELLRKIHLEGMALGFGVGFLIATGWPLFERAGAPPLEMVWVWTAMVFGWGVGQAIGRKRYA